MSGSPNTVLPVFEGGRDKRRRRSFNARSSRGNETEVRVVPYSRKLLPGSNFGERVIS